MNQIVSKFRDGYALNNAPLCSREFHNRQSSVLITYRPFYSCLLSDLAFEWQQGWSWPCFDTDLTPFVVLIKLFLCKRADIYMRKAEVGIKARSTPALLVFLGQVTKKQL